MKRNYDNIVWCTYLHGYLELLPVTLVFLTYMQEIPFYTSKIFNSPYCWIP